MLPIAPPAQIQQAPESLGALLGRARAAKDQGKLADALAGYDAILAQAPEHETVLLERAQVLSWMGRFKEAEAGYTEFRRRYPSRGLDADLRLAQVAAWDGRFAQAHARLEPWVTAGHRQAVIDDCTYLAWEGRLGASLERLAPWMKGHPEDLEAAQLDAKVRSWTGRTEDARRAFNAILQRWPGDREATLGLARMSLWASDPQGARTAMAALPEAERRHADSQLMEAQLQVAEGHPRAARAILAAARIPGKDAQDLREDLVDRQGPWVEASFARTDTSEGLRVEEPGLRARMPLGDGFAEGAWVGRRLTFGTQEQKPTEAGLTLNHPLGAKWWASAALRRTDLAGEGASSHSLGLGWSPLPGLSFSLEQSRQLATFTPSATAGRVAMSGVDLSGSWRPGGGPTALSAGGGRYDLSAGSVRRSFFVALEHRLPFTWGDLHGGLSTRGFGYSETLALGFFNPERYRYQGLSLGAAWRRGRGFELGLDTRLGRQSVNADPTQTTWGWSASASWRPALGPALLFATWSATEAGLPVTSTVDPASYREHTLRFGVRIRAPRRFW
ncbi:MAG TPA: tetratricopeptide repeat protein [Holophagaceae bacterium]|nr:tetratricopeptide repeat protein [Holophagaceae bacterium]